MDRDVIAPNHLRGERLAAGFDTRDELAQRAGIDVRLYERMESGHLLPTRDELERLQRALGGVSVQRLYGANFRQLIGVDGNLDSYPDAASVIKTVLGAGRLFVGKDEVPWFDQPPRDAAADVYLSMSCGFYAVPHLLLDAVAV